MSIKYNLSIFAVAYYQESVQDKKKPKWLFKSDGIIKYYETEVWKAARELLFHNKKYMWQTFT